MPSGTTSASRSRGRRSIKSKATSRSTASKNSSPYDRSFQQSLIDNHVYPYGYVYPDGHVAALPTNWHNVRQKRLKRRASLSPSNFTDQDHARFKRMDATVTKENQIQSQVLPTIEGKQQDLKTTSGNIPFTNFARLTTNEALVSGNPDLYHKGHPEQLVHEIRQELRDFIMPSIQEDLPMLPNFLVTAKELNGIPALALR